MKINSFICSVFLMINSVWSHAQNDRSSDKLNIVYIMTDDHSYQTISAYGGELTKLAPTPNLDRRLRRVHAFQRKTFVENSLSALSCLFNDRTI